MKNVNLEPEQIAKYKADFEAIIKSAKKETPSDEQLLGTWILNLERIGGNDYAIVVAWQNGFDKDDPDTIDGYSLCAKVGFQSKNNIMQCDYDIDWDMPYNDDSEIIWDSEVSNVCETDFDWLIENWNQIRRSLLLNEMMSEYLQEGFDEYDFMIDAAKKGFLLSDFATILVDREDWSVEFCKTHSCGFADEPIKI